jgi:lysophospholipase L1-like esterase
MKRLSLLILILALLSSCSDQVSTLEIDDGPLVYVPMGNSFAFWPAGNGVMDMYAEMLETDFGVAVELRNHTVGGQAAVNLLGMLRYNEAAREDLADADVITFIVPNDEWTGPIQTAIGYAGREPSDCGGDDNQQCLRDMISEFEDCVDEIFEELTAIADPSEVLIRVHDAYLMPTDAYNEETKELILPYWEAGQVYVDGVAGSYGIPVAHVFSEFMGPNGTGDPEARGLISGDHVHTNTAGARRTAALIHDLGYELAG